ncbi:MAG: COR domain-containing protein [Bacteroidota bacterium]
MEATIVSYLEKKYKLSIPMLSLSEYKSGNTIGYCQNDLFEIISLKINQQQLSEFPKEIITLKKLVDLQLISTGIPSIPDNISDLENLEALYVNRNGIKSIPRSISKLKKLKKLRLNHNPIENIPPEIIHQGLKAIQEYLSSLSGIVKSLNEVKVILVGDGGSGKTSVLKRLLNDDFDISENKTHGIRILKDNFQIEKQNFKINFWDFGGQEIMHSTHQFFLSKRSLYVLVLDGRKEEDPEYWLKHIETFGGFSPVIVLLNKYDDNPSFEVNRKFLQEKFKNIVGFIKISCKTKYNFTSFIKLLKSQISKIDHISTKWPEEWFNIKKHLEELETDYITYNDYERICNEYDLGNVESQKTLIDFLNDLGVILHFNDINLNETNVINPHWITTAVYSIVNSEKVANERGEVNLSNLSRILNVKTYPVSKYGYIIGLMKKFELCYSIDESKILIPDLLDIQEPEYEFDNETQIKFHCCPVKL